MSNSTTSRIDFLLAARDNASATLRSVSNEMKGLDNAAGMLAGGLSAIAVGAGLQGLTALAQTLDELGRRGAILTQIGSVFEDFAGNVGQQSDAMLQAMKTAAQGTISEFDLILNANRALQFEVAKTPAQLAQLIELSTALGRAQGISDQDALGYITLGVARRSKLILDNLGLMIDMDQAEADYAATLGKTASQLTNAEKNAAILAEAYRQGATAIEANRDAADSAATQYERLDANVRNLLDSFGALIAEANRENIKGVADAAEGANNVLTGRGDLPDWLIAGGQALEDWGASAEAATVPALALSTILQLLGRGIQVADQETRNSIAAIDTRGEAIREAAAAEQAAELAARAAAAAIAEQGRSAALAAIDTAALTNELANLAGSNASAIISGAKSIIPIVGAERAKEIAKAQLRTLQEQSLEMEKQGVDGLDLTFQMEELRLQTTGVFEDIRDADRAAQKMATQTVPQIDRAFEELRGKVAGVLSGALDTGTGVDPDEILAGLGFRSDAINENARRLADVAVKGFDSPWYEYFRTEFPALFQQFFAGATSPDGVKAQAANLLKNFQDGLNPELLDKETAKERVRRMLIGEAKMEELATEIANELAAELGNVSVGQAGAAARIALGLSAEDVSAAKAGVDGSAMLPTPGIGQVTEQYGGLARTALDAFSEAARTYTEEANLGLEITGVLAGQLGAAASLEMIRGAARSQGAMWGSTFKESIGDIPEFIIDLIALRVVPRVEAAQQQQATTTGAR
jgi:hypothetical protein